MYDFETRQQFITMRALGRSLHGIAAELGIHKNTALKWNADCEAEIDAVRRNSAGMALAARGAGRIDRARKNAALFNRLAEKLLEEASQIDVQSLGAYIKLCRLLDKTDPPVSSDPEEPGCDLPDTLDLLANVRMPQRFAGAQEPEHVRGLAGQALPREQSEKGKPEDGIPEATERNPPDPGEMNRENATADSGEEDIPQMRADPPSDEAIRQSEEFWDFYRSKMGRN